MKSIVSAMFAGAAMAAKATTNECLYGGEGADIVRGCFGMYLNKCDELEIYPQSTCNVMAFKSTSVEWNAADISVEYFTYAM